MSTVLCRRVAPSFVGGVASMSGSTTGVPRVVPWAVDPPLVVVLRAAGTVRRAGRGGHRTLEASLGFGCARLIVGLEVPSVDGPLWRGRGFSPSLPNLERRSICGRQVAWGVLWYASRIRSAVVSMASFVTSAVGPSSSGLLVGDGRVSGSWCHSLQCARWPLDSASDPSAVKNLSWLAS